MKHLSTIIVITLLMATMSSCGNNDTEMKKQFVYGCLNSGSTKSVCRCTYETLEKKYDAEQLYNMMTDMQYFDALTAAVQRAQKMCLS